LSPADRFQILAGITGGIGLATGKPAFAYLTIVLLWFAVIELSTAIRAERRKGKEKA
jgi:hypothetical protein